jgi:exodeoxyribonuclease VII small subunit
MPKITDKEPKNFEAAMAELDALVERMEAGELPLEESLTAYQRGTTLLAYCQKILSDAQGRVQALEGGADGKLKDLPE